MPELPFVTVAVPTYNRREHLETCLKAVAAQNYPVDRFEVVVVDDGSTDRSAELAEEMAADMGMEVIVRRMPHRGLNPGRNEAMSTARGELICLLDDDSIPEPSWLSAMVAGYLAQPDAGALGGPIQLKLDAPLPRSCGREPVGETEQTAPKDGKPPTTLFGSNLAIPRATFLSVGRFEEGLSSGGDETEWLERAVAAGRHLAFVPDAVVLHRRTADELKLRSLLVRRFHRARGQAEYSHLVGEGVSARAEVRQAVRSLAHSVRHRCAYGLLPVASALGRLAGIRRPR